MLPSVVPRLATDSAVRVFPGVWKLLSFKTPFLGWSSIPTSFVSLFIFYIFSYLLSKAMGCFSGCTTSARSQVDIDHPEPQEVLVSKEACLQFGR